MRSVITQHGGKSQLVVWPHAEVNNLFSPILRVCCASVLSSISSIYWCSPILVLFYCCSHFLTERCGNYIGGCQNADQLPPWLFGPSYGGQGKKLAGLPARLPIPLLRRLADGLVLWGRVQTPGACQQQMSLWHSPRTSGMTQLFPQGSGGCDPLTTVPLLPHSWGEEHRVDVLAQCSALSQWRQRLKPDGLMVLLTQHFI